MALNDFCNILDTSFTIAHSAGDPPEGKWKESNLYSVWRDMKIRCYNKNSPNYKNYGGRGISMDPSWKDDYPAFYRWAKAHGYREGLQLDRIDTNKNYTPKNCRFVTQSENLSNRRPYTIPNREDHISHHGRLGQKWGQRNGPPYPLYRTGKYSSGEKAAGPKYKTDKFPKEEKKSVKQTVKRGESNAGTQSGPSGYVRNETTETPFDENVNNIETKHGCYNVTFNKYNSSNTDIYKSSATYNTALASYNDCTHKEVTKTEFTTEDGDTVTRWVNPATLIASDESYLKTAPDSDSSGHSHSNGQITDDDMNDCNPGGNTTANRNQNCCECTATLELRKRGYDLSARRAYDGGRWNSQEFWFNGAETVKCNTPDEAKDLISSYGNGASGELHVEWGKNTNTHGAGAHSIHWTTDNDGKFEIQDGQTNTRYDSLDNYMQSHSDAWPWMNVTRLDNCEPNWEAIGNDSVVRSNPRTTDSSDCKILDSGTFNERSSGYAAAEKLVAKRRKDAVDRFNEFIDDGEYRRAEDELRSRDNYASDEIRDSIRTLNRYGSSNEEKESAIKFLKDTVAKDPVNTLLGRKESDWNFAKEPEDVYAEQPNINDYLTDDY